MIGKVLAAFRELVSAWLFGTGLVASAYRLSQSAFLIPLNGPVSDVLNAVFTPRFSSLRASDPARAQTLFASLHALLLAISVVVATTLFAFSDFWVRILAPGFSPEAAVLAARMVRILALTMPAYIAATLYAAADLTVGRGRLTASRASLQSGGLIAGTVLAWYFSQPLLIAVGFTAAYFWLAGQGIVSLRRAGLRFWIQRGQSAEMRDSLRVVWGGFRVLIWIPIVLQVHFVIERRVASLVDPHAIAALDYARFISDTAILLVAMPFGISGLSAMAVMSTEGFRAAAKTSMRTLLLIGIPLSTIIVTHPLLIVRLLFARGAFGENSIEVTTAILSGLGVGLWGQLVAAAGLKFLNARGHNRSVLLFTIIGAGCNILVNLLALHWGGARTLGYATAANGTVFGLLVLGRLGLLRELARELSVLLGASAAYVALWATVPASFGINVWVVGGSMVIFWSSVLFLVPQNRSGLAEFFSILRPAPSAQ
jgi:putative peptidoglycan lipid II flippase